MATPATAKRSTRTRSTKSCAESPASAASKRSTIAPLSPVGAKKTAGMRLEGERRRFPPERLGARQRRRDHGAVAAMHAVEIADGDDGAVERVVRGRFAPHHDERLSRRRLVGHERRRNGPRKTLQA